MSDEFKEAAANRAPPRSQPPMPEISEDALYEMYLQGFTGGIGTHGDQRLLVAYALGVYDARAVRALRSVAALCGAVRKRFVAAEPTPTTE
jgi:hypothetical protein